MREIDQRRAVLMIKWEGSGAPLTVAMDAHVLLVNRRSLTYVDAHPSHWIYLEGEAEVKIMHLWKGGVNQSSVFAVLVYYHHRRTAH